MKKIINTIVAMLFAVFAITSVSAQHGGGHHGGFSRGGGHSSFAHASHRSVSHYSTRSFSGNRGGRVNYARGGSYNRGMVYGRGGVYNHGGYYGRGGYYAGGRRPFVAWAGAHRYGYGRPVYFPAYHLYYDPFRGGYTFWSGGRWLFSNILPNFLAGIDLAAAQMAYAANIPQAYYPQDGGDYNDDGYYPPAPPIPSASLNVHVGL